MAFVPVPNTVQVNFKYLLDGQDVENILYFERSSAIGAGDVATLLEQLNTWARAELLPLLHTTLSLIEIVGRILDAVDSLSFVSTTSLPASGEVGGAVMPNNVAYVLTLRTGLAGRSFRGRNYIAGLPEASVLGNRIKGPDRTALLAAYNELIDLAIDNGWELVVVSRISGGVERTTGVTTPVTNVTTFDNVLDSQRRRLPGRGN